MSANEIPLCKVTVAKEKNILIGDQLQMLLQFCKCRCWTFASKVGPYRLHTSYVKIHTSDVFIILLFIKKPLWDMVQDCPFVLYRLLERLYKCVTPT